MADSSVFDRLVASLSSSERQDMLHRLREKTLVPDRELEADFETEPIDTERVYRSMGLLRRFFIIIRTIFLGKSRSEVVADELLAELGATIRKDHADLIDIRGSLLLEPFHDELVRLRSSAHFFADIVERAWTGRRNAFLAFLLGLDLPDVQQRLIADTDPFRAAQEEPDLPEHQLKRKLHAAALQALDLMPMDGRESLYRNARFLEGLRQLSTFRFIDLIGAFDSTAAGRAAAFFSVREPLERLATTAQLLGVSPSARLVEALVLFARDDELERGTGDLEGSLVVTVQQAVHHLRVIWTSIDTLPLTDLIRYLNGDVNYRLKAAGGGEEWMNLIKRFWRERTDLAFSRYQFTRQKMEAISTAAQYTEGITPESLPGYPGAVPGSEGRHAASLGLVRALLEGAYRKFMYAPLKTLLIDGEFYKEANRDEFTGALASLEAEGSAIGDLLSRLSEHGDLGRTLRAIGDDGISREERNQNLAAVSSQVDEIAAAIINRVLSGMHAISDVIYGILYGEIGGRHDTLANLGTIGGRSHQQLMAQLDEVMNRANACRESIGKIFDIENSIARRFRKESGSFG